MNILELSDVLNDISDFVNGCLGPLGANGLSNIATYAVDLGVQPVSYTHLTLPTNSLV